MQVHSWSAQIRNQFSKVYKEFLKRARGAPSKQSRSTHGVLVTSPSPPSQELNDRPGWAGSTSHLASQGRCKYPMTLCQCWMYQGIASCYCKLVIFQRFVVHTNPDVSLISLTQIRLYAPSLDLIAVSIWGWFLVFSLLLIQIQKVFLTNCVCGKLV